MTENYNGMINAHSMNEAEVRALEEERRDNYQRGVYREEQRSRMLAGKPLLPEYDTMTEWEQAQAGLSDGYDVTKVPEGVYPSDWQRVFGFV